MTSTNAAVKDCIYRNPGLHFNAIGRHLDIATGQTQYHLRRLTNQEAVQKEAICGRTHYYPPTYSAWERGTIALLRRETTREVVLCLLQTPGMQPAKIASRLDLARSTIEWHLSRLVEYGVVTKTASQNGTHGSTTIRLRNEEAVYRLLREIEPRLIDRLVDRFANLADDLLTE